MVQQRHHRIRHPGVAVEAQPPAVIKFLVDELFEE
jgi:hypothetical protein